MNRILIVSFAVIAVVIAIFVVVANIPEKPTECKSGDGLCPAQCNADADRDCQRSRTTGLGEVRHCLSDRDCIAVRPICGNQNCLFTDYECKSGKYCTTAIGKDYLAAWNGTRAKCTEPIETNCEPPENFKAACAIGTCVVIGKAA